MQFSTTSEVTLDSQGIMIRGKREIILCASLFYFRIPEGNWEDRMGKIKLAGYNCIDVYFPWNFHELHRDEWDFTTGMRDVDTFLSLAEKHGLYVMARPGPYICSEWDGGSLPAYLFGEGIHIRQNDPAYLARVEEWYKRILPIISRHQIDEGGSVVLFQIENELDFFACGNVPGYLSALAVSSRRHGITVPIIACAGQGDINGAWGSIDDAAPAMNLYLDAKIPGLEDGIKTYTQLLADLETPLMVVEMGQDNLLMRRYLASGAKLLGPYNQVSGFDFGFTESINNWGDPVLFLPSYYDFHSLITPFGTVRDFIAEDRVLSSFMKTMGSMLAGSVVSENGVYKLSGPGGEQTAPPVLSLDCQDAAEAISVSNLSDQTTVMTLRCEDDVSYSLELPACTSSFILRKIDLSVWGIPAVLDSATAEPVFVQHGSDPVIVFTAPFGGMVRLMAKDNLETFTFGAESETHKEIALADGRTLLLIGIPRAVAFRMAGFENSELILLDEDFYAPPRDTQSIDLTWVSSETGQRALAARGIEPASRSASMALEKNGIVRGYGMYSIEGELSEPRALALHGAADVISIYRNGTYMDTRYPGGSDEIILLPEALETGVYDVRTEIWGHSNFDDSRKPAIRISSMRGLSGCSEIREIVPLPVWRTESPSGGSIPYYTNFGKHLTTDRPSVTTWYNTIAPVAGDDTVLLAFDGMTCTAEIEINGKSAGSADQFTRVVDLTPFIAPGIAADLTVTLKKRHSGEPSGTVSVLFGKRLRRWKLTGLAENELLIDAAENEGQAAGVDLPLSLNPGDIRWLYGFQNGAFSDQSVELKGENCKVTLFFNGVICGRMFLPTESAPIGSMSETARKAFALGYLPGCWSLESENKIVMLIEAVGNGPAVVESIDITAVP